MISKDSDLIKKSTQFCTTCGKLISRTAKYCLYCGILLPKFTIINNEESQPTPSAEVDSSLVTKAVSQVDGQLHITQNPENYSGYTSISKIVMLIIISFGLYDLVWLYKALKSIKRLTHSDKPKSGWFIASLFIPIANLYALNGLFKKINQLGKEINMKINIRSDVMTIFFVAIGVLANKIPENCLYIPVVLSAIIPAYYQRILNRAWLSREPDLLKVQGITTWEWIMVILGLIWNILFIIGLYGQ